MIHVLANNSSWGTLLNQLNYHHLLYFREIAIAKSVSKAAEKLKIGQPALSGQLKILEDRIGAKLFERKNRMLILTEAGNFALKCANEIYQTGNFFIDVMEKGALSSKVRVSIGALECVPKHLLLKLITDAKELGDCQIRIQDGTPENLLKELKAHTLDILLLNYHAPVSSGEGLYSRSLTKNVISIYGAPEFKHLRQNFPQSINGQAIVLPTYQSKLRHDIDHYFLMNNLKFNIYTETQDISIQKLLGTSGLCLVPLPDFSTTELVKEKKLVKLGTMDSVYEEFSLVYAKRMIDNPLATRLAKEFNYSLN